MLSMRAPARFSRTAVLLFSIAGMAVLTCSLAGRLPSGRIEASEAAAAPVLRAGVGARGLGLGGAHVAVARDITAVHWNPAGLAHVAGPEGAAMRMQLFADTTLDYLAYGGPLRSVGTLAVSVLHLRSPDIPETSPIAPTGGEFTYGETAVYGSLGRRLDPQTALGISLKFVSQQVGTHTATGLGIDVGLQREVAPGLVLGITGADIAGTRIRWDTGHVDEVAPHLRAGGSVRVADGKGLLALDLTGGDRLHLGGEWRLAPGLNLRAGVDTGLGAEADLDRTFSVGLGLDSGRAALDYALTLHSELGASHTVSLGVRF